MKRRSSTEREAAKLAKAFEAAEADLRDREEQFLSIEEATERTRREAGLAKAVGEIDVVEYVSRTEKATALEAETRAARDQAGAVLEAVRGPAADAHEALAYARVEAAISDVDERGAELADAERMVEERRRALADANDRLALEQRKASDARAPFDEAARLSANAREAQAEEEARWFARNPHEDNRIPVHLRQRVPEIRAEEQSREEAERERLRQRPDRLDQEEIHSGGSIRPHEPFPRLGDPL